jgi:hypothetical protein
MLIHVLNIKLTCEWHETIKFSYKKAGTRVIVVLRVSIHFRLADYDVTFLSAHSQLLVWSEMEPLSRTYADKTCQLILIVHRSARIPHFSLAIISVTVQLWTYVFWVISVYFTIRNTLPKSGTCLLGHPVYIKRKSVNRRKDSNPRSILKYLFTCCKLSITWNSNPAHSVDLCDSGSWGFHLTFSWKETSLRGQWRFDNLHWIDVCPLIRDPYMPLRASNPRH